jgi:hypothetical protein
MIEKLCSQFINSTNTLKDKLCSYIPKLFIPIQTSQTYSETLWLHKEIKSSKTGNKHNMEIHGAKGYFQINGNTWCQRKPIIGKI